MVTLKSDKAPTAHGFTLDLPEGAELVPNDQGGYDIAKRLPGGGTTVMGQVDAPWAKDATGKSLPTRYTLDNDTLTQSVDTDGAVFPVVADPHYTWGIVTGTIYLNRSETRSLAQNGGIVGTIVALIPAGITKPAGATIAYWTWEAQGADRAGQCVNIKVPHLKANRYTGGYCR
ncbi:hypothetical protein [Streptomyces sp. NRRL WC-3742]|uniref:hypothetical protein n=1 Tax=Streptomyces sp. NRRL WC-3742 TaxID=1463934 RepID=UPI0004C54E62|nr:hypothetical protein [Streptomyces sp. NRRL WC-3742]